jgi:hypothetical protein
MYQQISNTLGCASLSLFTLGLCATSFTAMNIVRMIENAGKLAKLTQDMEEKLNRIPQSHLNGIEALPLELWSQIIEHLLDPYLQPMKRQCWDLPRVLELRLLCRKFRDMSITRQRANL